MTSSVNLLQVDFLLRKSKYILSCFTYAYLKVQKCQHFNRKSNFSPGVTGLHYSVNALLALIAKHLNMQTEEGKVFDFLKHRLVRM